MTKYIVEIADEITKDSVLVPFDMCRPSWWEEAYKKGKADAEAMIIHCKDCKYSQLTYDGQCKYCEQWEDDEGYLIELRLDGDFYCGYAERREDENN